jgi:glutathione S-transferase
LIHRCDAEFKPLLDRYKYADRHLLLSQAEHRGHAEIFLQQLEQRLVLHDYLHDDRCRLVDVAIMPFVRQFAGVDAEWFEGCQYQRLGKWLNTLLTTELFINIMKKHPFWQPGDDVIQL